MIVFFILTVVDRLEETLITNRLYERLSLVTEPDRDIVARVLLGLAEKGILTQGVIIEEEPERGALNVSLTVRTVSGFRRQAVADWLVRQPGIERLQWGQ